MSETSTQNEEQAAGAASDCNDLLGVYGEFEQVNGAVVNTLHAENKRIRSKLIRLAAEMARHQGMPDARDWPWPGNASRKLFRAAVHADNKAAEQCRQWAIALRDIADELTPNTD